MKRIAMLTALTLLVACGARTRPLPNPMQLHGKVDRGGRFIVVVIDVSGSMESADARRYNELGAHLGISLSGPNDNFGAVAFSTSGRLLSAMRQVGDKKGRRDLHGEVTYVSRGGQTNFVDGLRWANGLLTSVDAPADSAVIFLTDGEHNIGGSENDVLQQIAFLKGKDWRVFTVGLGREAGESALLRRMAVATKGAHFGVEKAEDLLTAFLSILGQIHNFMFFEGKPEPVRLFQGTSRLVYLVIKEEHDATVAALTRDGADVDPRLPTYNKYPEAVESSVDLEVASVETPEPGVWDIRLQGKARVGAILQQPPFTVRLDEGRLRSEYFDGEDIDIALLVEGGGDDAQKYVRDNGKATAVVRSESTGQELMAVNLAAAGGSSPVTFTGAAVAKAGGEPELHTIVAKLSLGGEGGGSWRHEVRVSVMVKPGKRPVGLKVSPGELDLGARWADSGPASAELQLSSTGASLAATLTPASPQVRLTPAGANIGPGGTRVQVTVDPSTLPTGDFASSIDITATKSELEEPEKARIPVRMKVAKLEGAPPGGSFSLGNKVQGESFDAAVGVSASGGEVIVEPLKGAGTIEPKLEDGKLTGTVPVDAAEGDYAGQVVVRVPGFPDRKFPVKLTVRAAKVDLAAPTEVDLGGGKAGLYEKEITLKLDYNREVDVEMSAGELTAGSEQIRADWVDVRAVKEDWDGKKLAPGKEARVKVSVEVKTDHVNGSYSGKVTVVLKGASGELLRKEITLKVKVEQ